MNDRASSVLVDREGNVCSDPSHVAELHALRTHLICARECMVAAESYRLRSYMASSRAEHAALLERAEQMNASLLHFLMATSRELIAALPAPQPPYPAPTT